LFASSATFIGKHGVPLAYTSLVEDSLALAIASLICLGIWGVMALAVGAAGHVRMKRVEAALGRRAEPSPERIQLFYAGASVVWLSAVVLALVGLVRRDWARMGRNCLFIFLAHITLIVALVPFVMPRATATSVASPVPMLILVCAIVAISALVSAFFASRWAFLRARRIEAEPATDAQPIGGLRYLLYLGSLALWPAGLVAVLVFSKPENARVGAKSFLFSLVNMVGIALLVCIGLPLLAQHFR